MLLPIYIYMIFARLDALQQRAWLRSIQRRATGVPRAHIQPTPPGVNGDGFQRGGMLIVEH